MSKNQVVNLNKLTKENTKEWFQRAASNRSISLEAYEKLAKNFMQILEQVTSNLAFLEVNYWEAFTKYPFRQKYNKWEKIPKLKDYEIHEKKIKADKTLNDLMNLMLKEEDRLSEQLQEKYGVEVLSERQRHIKADAEFEAAEAAKEKAEKEGQHD